MFGRLYFRNIYKGMILWYVMKNKCECQNTANLMPGMESWYDQEKELPFVTHKPGECKCTNELKQYWKNDKKVWLCSNCIMGEEPVKKWKEYFYP